MAKTKNGGPSRREKRLMESESRWLQKALFALSKAEAEREKLAKLRDGEVKPVEVEINDETVALGDVRSAMESAVLGRAERLRKGIFRRSQLIR